MVITRPVPPDRRRNPVRLQIVVRPGDGVGILRELRREFANGRDMLMDAERPCGDGEFHLPYDLLIDRDAVVGFNMEDQDCTSMVVQCAQRASPSIVSRENPLSKRNQSRRTTDFRGDVIFQTGAEDDPSLATSTSNPHRHCLSGSRTESRSPQISR